MKKLYFLLLLTSISVALFAQKTDEAAATELIKHHAATIGLTKSTADDYAISSTYVSNGTQYVYLIQTYKGLPLRNQMKVLTFTNKQLRSNAGNFIENIGTLVNGSATPTVSPYQAATAAFLSQKLPTPTFITKTSQINKFVFNKVPSVTEDVSGELMWLPIEQQGKFTAVKLIWQVIVAPANTDDMWQIFVDANTGEILGKSNLTVHDSFDTDKSSKASNANIIPALLRSNNNETINKNNFSPSIVADANYLVIPYPAESPSHPGGAPAIRNNPWAVAPGTTATFGWHSTGTTDYNITRGNNAWATEDTLATNQNTGTPATSTTGPGSLTFNNVPNFNQDPRTATNQAFTITNLFYWNNIVHDITYQYGFNEAAGNFQTNNQSLGGNGNDNVIALAQSYGSGVPIGNNANFSTPTDGARPRMRMYLFSPVANNVLHVNAPASIVGDYNSVESGFSTANKLANVGPVTAAAVFYDDSPGGTHEACGGAPTNNVSGKIAIIRRGNCAFTVKVLNAQNAGAIAVIMINNVAGAPIIMGGTDNTITIPAVMISQADSAIITNQINNGLNITLSGSAGVVLDGDLDNGVIAHEYGHGVSNRLTGGPANTSCLQNAEQGGEGWSDYLGLMLTTNWATTTVNDGGISRGVGTYVIGQSPSGLGIRNFPYTTNIAVNTLTYANMGVGAIGTEVHNIGEIWCMAIWEMTWAIIQQENAINTNLYNFSTSTTGGNSVALKLVLEGMKLQVCSPGFIDSRNGILAADRSLYNGKYACSIWTAFAKRGMGYSANQGSSASATDQTAATDLPPAPTIATQPTNTSVVAGATATFTADAGTDVNLIYQWQVSTDGGVTYNNVVPAVITPTLNISPVSCTMNGYKYRARIFIGCAVTVSNVVTLTVTGCAVAPTITSQPAATAVCAGNTATFTAAASGTGNTYNWEVSTNGGTNWASVTPANTTTTLTLTNVTVGMNNNQYRLVATNSNGTINSNGAILTVNASPAAPTVTTPVVYCQGATATALTATGTNLLWYTTATGGTGSTTAPIPSTATVGTVNYYVTQTSGTCESPRAQIAVTTNTTPAAPTVTSPVAYCQGATATQLTATGTNLKWYLVATGGASSTTAPTPSTATVGTTNYYVSQTTGTCEGPRALIAVNVTATPAAPTVTTPVTYCQNTTAVPLTATGSNLLWYNVATGGTGSATAPTPSTTTVGSTNYYVSQTTGCESPRAQITVTVVAGTAAPTVTTPVVYCQGATATALTATGTNLLWYTTATGGTSSSTAPIPSTATVGTVNYYVTQTSGTCESPRAQIAVTTNTTPAAPTVTSPVAYCQGATATQLTATGTNLKWYLVATGGASSTTAPTPSTATVGTTNYYVSQTTGTCEGPRALIAVNVTATPAAPTVTTPVTYCQNTTAVPLTATGSNLLWYTVATGGTGTATAPTPSTTTVGNTLYYVSQTTGCESPRAQITVIVNATPAAPTATSPLTYCQNATAVPLTATGSNLLWYLVATGGTSSATAPTPATTTAGTTLYYVSQTTGNCESPRTAISVVVNATPAAPTVTSTVVYCQNTTATPLTATGTNLMWYIVATGGTGSATAPTPSTTTIGTTNYYVSQTLNGCTSARAFIAVTVTAPTAAPTVTSPVVYCQGATAVALTATGSNLLWYTTATGGTGSATAPIPTTTTAGNTIYYVSQTVNCESPRASITVTVNATPTAPTAASPINYCQAAPALPLTATGTNLLWYATATGGTGSTTAPVPSTATAGTTNYYVTQSTNGCESPRTTIIVNVTSAAIITSQPTSITSCTTTATFSVTASGTGITYQWQVSTDGGLTYTNISGATNSSVTINGLTAAQAGNRYRVVVGSSCGNVNSNAVQANVGTPPSIVLTAAPSTAYNPSVAGGLYTTVSPVGNYVYQWKRDNVILPTILGPQITRANGLLYDFGTYQVSAIDVATGCIGLSNTVVITDIPAQRDKLFVSPNPTNGVTKVTYYSSSTASVNRILNVYDAKGQRMLTKNFTTTGRYGSVEVDFTNMQEGTYVIELRDETGKRIVSTRVVRHF